MQVLTRCGCVFVSVYAVLNRMLLIATIVITTRFYPVVWYLALILRGGLCPPMTNIGWDDDDADDDDGWIPIN